MSGGFESVLVIEMGFRLARIYLGLGCQVSVQPTVGGEGVVADQGLRSS